jgi:hypothetical protein
MDEYACIGSLMFLAASSSAQRQRFSFVFIAQIPGIVPFGSLLKYNLPDPTTTLRPTPTINPGPPKGRFLSCENPPFLSF